MNEQKNLILAVALSALILIGFQWMFPPKHQATQPAQTTGAPPVPAETDSRPPVPAAPGVPGAPAVAAPASPVETRSQALEQSLRVPIRTAKLHGSLALTGARIDDLTLMQYHATPDPTSPEINLLSPAGSPDPYFAEFGFVTADPAIKTPGPDSIWQPTKPGAELTEANPVVLTWDNGQGLRFVRTYAVDEQYMFSVTQRVENYGQKPAQLFPYAFIARTGTPKTAGMYILHEGPLGVLDGTLKELKYDELRKERRVQEKTAGGWLGITDKYWLTAVIPSEHAATTGRFVYEQVGGQDRYQVDFTQVTPVDIPAGGSAESGFHFFAGAKIVSLLDQYGEKFDIPRFSYAIDFGWFWFLTKPFFYILRMLHDTLGNMGLAIIAMTVMIKLLMFPLANKSYVSMSKMKKVQPEVQRLQKTHGEDKVRLQQEIMALYKREKVNPASGCLPMLVQIPVFFALYKVLFVTIEMRHAPFIGWIHDLSAPDPTTFLNLFGLIPWNPDLIAPAFLHIGVWPLVMGVTMYLQQKLNPAPADPIQAKMFQFLPIMFTFLLGQFAAGLVIYWAWSNTLSILQQWVIMKKAAATE